MLLQKQNLLVQKRLLFIKARSRLAHRPLHLFELVLIAVLTRPQLLLKPLQLFF